MPWNRCERPFPPPPTGHAGGAALPSARAGGLGAISLVLLTLLALGPSTASAAPPAINSFQASPASIAPGQAATLSWTTSAGVDAFVCSGVFPLDRNPCDPLPPPVPLNGSSSTGPLSGPTVFVLFVRGAGELFAQAALTVAIAPAVPPTISSFVASPSSVQPGQSTTLTWSTTGAFGVGIVQSPCTGTDCTILAEPSGSRTVTISATTLFILSAVGEGGEAWRSIMVSAGDTCSPPATPSAQGPAGPLPPLSAFNVSWADVFGASDPAGTYEAQLALDPSFATVVQSVSGSRTTAGFSVPSNAGAAVHVRVRAVAGCGTASAFSSPVAVPVAAAPATVAILQGQTPAWAVRTGEAPPPATIVVRNLGGVAADVRLETTGGFFSVAPPSATLGPGQQVSVVLTAAATATGRSGLQQGSVTAASGGSRATTPVTLTVADVTTDAVPEVEPAAVYNLSSSSVSETTVQVRNPGAVPMALSTSIGPGGAWLAVETADVSSPLQPGETRGVRLRIDRSRRTSDDGAPPVSTVLELAAVGAAQGRAVRVFDAEPASAVETTERPPAPAATPSFVVPTAVHAGGVGGSLFTSDGWVRNLGASAITLDLLAAPRDGGRSLKAATTLPPLGLVRLYDFVNGVFGRTDLTANVELRPRNLADAAQLAVRITTEGQPAGGRAEQRYASELPVYASGSGTGVGQRALVMVGIEVSASVRTNIILSETSGASAGVHLTLYGPDGAHLGKTAAPIALGPFGIAQGSVASLLGLSPELRVASGWLRIEGASGAGRVVALGTAIDNVSQSFRALTVESSRIAPAGGRPALAALSTPAPRVTIPAVVHARGINAFFTSTLEVMNETAAPATLRLVYQYSGTDGAGQPVNGTKAADVTLPPRNALSPTLGRDVVAAVMALPPDWNTSGSLGVEGPGVAQVIVRSWVQTPADTGKPEENLKYAEFRGFVAADAEVVGTGAASVLLSPGVERIDGKRTNLILAEVAGAPAQVTVRLVDGASGLAIGESAPIALAAYEKVQVNDGDLWERVGLGSGQRDRLQLALVAGGGTGRVAGVLTQIDNASNATLVTPFAPLGPQAPGIGVGR